MPETGYEPFEGLDPFFEVVMGGLRGIVDGKHYFDVARNLDKKIEDLLRQAAA
jgi:hypothetical protein